MKHNPMHHLSWFTLPEYMWFLRVQLSLVRGKQYWTLNGSTQARDFEPIELEDMRIWEN